jgi:hypothetical protein
MPRIPIIEQTTSVSTSTPTPQAQGMQIASPLSGIAGAAAGLDAFAGGIVEREHALQIKENADAVANTGKPLSDATVYWKQNLTDLSQKTIDGGLLKNEDGTTIGLRPKIEKDFDSWGTSFLAEIKNHKAKVYAQEYINKLRTHTLDTALEVEAKQGIANRASKVDEAVQTWAGSAARDASNVDDLILSAKTMIANSGFDEATRNAKAKQATQHIIESAAMGEIERNPYAARSALIARYGVNPMDAPPSASNAAVVPPGVAAGVLKYRDAITKNASESGVDASIMAWQLDKESKGNPKAVNNADIRVTGSPSIGIAQFQPATAKRFNIDPTDPEQSIKGQAAYMGELLKQFGGDYSKALAGYNWGEGNVQKAITKYGDDWLKHAPASTQDYVKTIQDNAAKSGQPDKQASTLSEGKIPLTSYSPQMAKIAEQIPPEKLQAYISHATAQVNQQQALVRSKVSTTENDQVAAFMNGQTVAKPLSEGDYIAAYGASDGSARYANFKSIQQLGQDISTVKVMPPGQMEQLANSYKPDPNKPGYDLANKRYETVLKAIGQVSQQRNQDPVAYAISNGIGGAKPIDFQDQKAFISELNKRQGIASTMQSTYGTQYAILSKDEASLLQKSFDGMTTNQKTGYLSSIYSALNSPGAYRSVMGQVASDSPVTAMAGVILSKQSSVVMSHMFSDDVYQAKDVAGLILEGEALINPTKSAKNEDGKGRHFPMPKEQDIRDQFNSVVGRAFSGDPRGADFAYQAVKSYYAGRASREGDISGNTNSGILKESINAVIGGVSDINGKGEVVRPWGMSETLFRNAVKTAFDSAIKANNYTGTQFDNYGIYGLQSAGDSKYLLRTGTGTLTDRQGNPIVIDLYGDNRSINQIPTDTEQASNGGVNVPNQTPKTQGPVTNKPKTK